MIPERTRSTLRKAPDPEMQSHTGGHRTGAGKGVLPAKTAPRPGEPRVKPGEGV